MGNTNKICWPKCPITKRAFSLESHRLAMSPAIWVEQFATDLSTTPSMHGHSPRIGPGSHFSLQVPICIYHSTSTGSEMRFVVPPGGPRGVKSIWRPGPGISKAGATRIEATKETSLHVSSSAYGKYRRYWRCKWFHQSGYLDPLPPELQVV